MFPFLKDPEKEKLEEWGLSPWEEYKQKLEDHSLDVEVSHSTYPPPITAAFLMSFMLHPRTACRDETYLKISCKDDLLEDIAEDYSNPEDESIERGVLLQVVESMFHLLHESRCVPTQWSQPLWGAEQVKEEYGSAWLKYTRQMKRGPHD